MTARRSSATERRGTALPRRRPTAILLAAGTAITLGVGLGGCASRNASTGQLIGKTLPGNQDTAAGLLHAAAPPTTPPGQATPYGHLSPPGNPKNNGHDPTPVPTTGPWTTDQAAWQAMGADVVTKVPPLRGSPSQNPVSPTPQLEIITMPMWLWVDPVMEQTTVLQTDGTTDTVIVRTVTDSAVWNLDGKPRITCGLGTPPPTNRGPGTPYITDYDPANAANAVPQACIDKVDATPYYSTSAGTLVAGVHSLTAAVTWHVEYEVLDSKGQPKVAWTAPVPAIGGAAPSTVNNPLRFRVGEVQALVTAP